MVNIKEKLSEGWIHCRIVLEMVGKPREHVEKAMKNIVDKIKGEKELIIVDEKMAEIQKKETGAQEAGLMKEMWATFVEMEILFKDMVAITYLCFEYMPSSIEILEPQDLNVKAIDLSEFFNDLQGKMHELNIIAKQLKSRNMFLEQNIQGMLNNFVAIVLGTREMTTEELSKITRVNKEALEDFLDKLVDEGKIEMVGEKYKVIVDGGKK